MGRRGLAATRQPVSRIRVTGPASVLGGEQQVSVFMPTMASPSPRKTWPRPRDHRRPGGLAAMAAARRAGSPNLKMQADEHSLGAACIIMAASAGVAMPPRSRSAPGT